MDKPEIYDIAVTGGGLAGLTLVCLLGQAGVKTACIDQAPVATTGGTGDLRTTAVSYGSRQILEKTGIWDTLDEKACPINDIQILDGHSSVLLNFLSTEVGDKSFGWIVLNSDLRAALLREMGALETVQHFTSTKIQDYQSGLSYVKCMGERGTGPSAPVKWEMSAKLVIGADGRQSFTREWMRVRTRQWRYNQRAVICTVAHEHPHHNVAVEHFWPEGPFAILPMSDGPGNQHCSSVVFTEHGPDSASLMRYDDQVFETALAARFPERYGDIRLIGRRACYPLGLVHAASYIAPRMALVADAAHGIHPIAGQGLNLGFRDVVELASLVIEAHERGEDVGDSALLETYQRRRRPDNMAMVAVTDSLNRLFSNNIPPVRLLRCAGLKLASGFAPAKQFFMRRAMGDR